VARAARDALNACIVPAWTCTHQTEIFSDQCGFPRMRFLLPSALQKCPKTESK
jgi:hypothetical protein